MSGLGWGSNGNEGGGDEVSVSCIHSSATYQYNGQNGWDGSPQYFLITPSIMACGSISFTLYGAGGSDGYYGDGGNNNPLNWGFGAGGSGFCNLIYVRNCGGTTGGANNGGLNGHASGNGEVIISW